MVRHKQKWESFPLTTQKFKLLNVLKEELLETDEGRQGRGEKGFFTC